MPKTRKKTADRTSTARRRAAPPPSALDRFRAFVRRILVRSGGGALVLLALWTATALATYSISDPSLNTATPAPVSNWAGPLGAVMADFLLQTMGGAAFILFPPMVIWGSWALTRGVPAQTDRQIWLRLLLVLPALILAAASLGAWPIPKSWPFVSGLGGFIGDGTLALLARPLEGLPAPYPGLAAAALASTLFLWAYGCICGLTRQRAEALLETCEGALEAIADTAEGVLARLTRQGRGADARRAPIISARPSEKTVEPAPGDATSSAANSANETLSGKTQPDTDGPASGEDIAAQAKRNIIRTEPKQRPGRREANEAQASLPIFKPGTYELPPLNLLAKPSGERKAVISDDALEQNARMLETVLSDFGVRGQIINVRPGPVVTLYELEPAAGVKSSRVIGLADDIARSMSAVAARVAVVPGRNVIGIELPNQTREMVHLRSQLATSDYENSRGDLTLSLGVDIGGEPVFADLARMPHLLIAGTTGSGKSVGINVMILSLLYRLSPDHCKLILIDPKMLELSVYDGIPHLLAPVVTDPRKAVVSLKWTVKEMEERYQKMSKLGVRNIAGFNERISEAEENGEALTRTMHTGYDQETGEPIYETEELDYEAMPYIVVVIDEVADLMMVAGKDIEAMVQRLAQMARAAGIHLIMATQRPSVDVITGTIKANFPTRISFQVTSKIDSRTILGEQGAEQLLGQGDMLYMAGGGRLRRVHGPFVSDNEVEKIVKFLKKQGKPAYVQEVTEMEDGEDAAFDGLDIGGNTSSGDALYDKAVAIVARDKKASTSYIQRRLQIGYNRAATLIERMEKDGVISPANHAGKREVLIGEDAA